MKALSSIDSGAINFGANHVLFVEGEPDSIDVSVLSLMLNISVKPLGPSAYVKSVAQAMHPAYPTFYFLVDRDHMDDDEVEELWQKFPNTDTPNLLVWRKKEIESYFIDPEYIIQSKYFVKGKTVADAQKILVNCARPDVYMAAANRVIVAIRECLKQKWVEKFSDRKDFPDAEAALNKLLTMPEFGAQLGKMQGLVSEDNIRHGFSDALRLLLGDGDTLVWGKGRWLDLMPAKGMMNALLGSSLFKVPDRNKKLLSGTDKINEIVKDLLMPDKKLPADFEELGRLMKVQMQRSA